MVLIDKDRGRFSQHILWFAVYLDASADVANFVFTAGRCGSLGRYLLPARYNLAASARDQGLLSAFTFLAVGVAVLLFGELEAVADEETGVAGEFVCGLGDDLDD